MTLSAALEAIKDAYIRLELDARDEADPLLEALQFFGENQGKD